MNYILFDGPSRNALLPFTFTRPVAEIRIGILTIREKWERYLGVTTTTLTEDYLSGKYPMVELEENVMINASFLPNDVLAEMIRNLLDDPDITGTELMAHDSPGRRAERGVGVIEAPRGTLIHHYRVNDDDQVVRANLIVSTTHNNQAMNEAIRAVARSELDGRTLTEALLNRIEVAIRAFDPCLSCATHALGRMPLALELVDAQGSVVDRLSRDSRGRTAA